MKFDPTEEIENEKAHSIIREIVADGTVTISKHAKKRILERNYSIQDIEHILLRGEIIKKEFNGEAQNWAYTHNNRRGPRR